MQEVRGAISAGENTPEAIEEATGTLLREMLARNALTPEAVVSAVFSVTEDLDTRLTAHAARAHGWRHVAVLETTEVLVPGCVPRCIRVRLEVEHTPAVAPVVGPPAVAHVFLREAAALAPERADPFPMSVETAREEMRRIPTPGGTFAVKPPRTK